MAKNKNRFRYKKFFSKYFEDGKEYLEANKELAEKMGYQQLIKNLLKNC